MWQKLSSIGKIFFVLFLVDIVLFILSFVSGVITNYTENEVALYRFQLSHNLDQSLSGINIYYSHESNAGRFFIITQKEYATICSSQMLIPSECEGKLYNKGIAKCDTLINAIQHYDYSSGKVDSHDEILNLTRTCEVNNLNSDMQRSQIVEYAKNKIYLSKYIEEMAPYKISVVGNNISNSLETTFSLLLLLPVLLFLTEGTYFFLNRKKK